MLFLAWLSAFVLLIWSVSELFGETVAGATVAVLIVLWIIGGISGARRLRR